MHIIYNILHIIVHTTYYIYMRSTHTHSTCEQHSSCYTRARRKRSETTVQNIQQTLERITYVFKCNDVHVRFYRSVPTTGGGGLWVWTSLIGGGRGGDMGKLNCIYIILYEYVILANAISLFYHSRGQHSQRIYGP